MNTNTPELLAPAGTIEVFETAVAAGADAVYIGAPTLNARALAKNFSMAEIAAMIDHAHRRQVKVFLAMNSLVREEELPRAVRILAMIEALGADGLILQDLGLYRLARKHFPGLRLHASTLLAAHNSIAVSQLAKMGFARVVLARELTLQEINAIRAANPEVEIEVFIHGALCFSYSGLCLFSSFLGGKSGLRGRCVQPCRRRYTWSGSGSGPQSGYFFSMHDLAGLDFLTRLRSAGITSFKIEGRMRSSHYVGAVVAAYRLAMDHPDDTERLEEAAVLLEEAMGRKTTSGYFPAPEPPAAFSPEHSGNIGLFLGRIKEGGTTQLRLQSAVKVGDRLRLHQEQSGERLAFTLKKMWKNGSSIEQSKAGALVAIKTPVAAAPGDSLFKVDTGERRARENRMVIKPGRFAGRVKKIEAGLQLGSALRPLNERRTPPASNPLRKKPGPRQASPALPWRLRIDDLRLLKQHLYPPPQQLLITIDRETFRQITQHTKLLKPHFRRLVWALPPIIEEGELGFFREAIGTLQRRGFSHFQLGHIGQLQLFAGKSGKVVLSGDFTLNVLNSLAVGTLKDLGLKEIQLAIETDRDNLQRLCRRAGNGLGLTVYATPALFTARPGPAHFRYHQPFTSPKGEKFILQRQGGLTFALPQAPFSLLGFLPELAASGLTYAVIDLSRMRLRKGALPALVRKVSGSGGRERLSTFNYLGTLR
jgi:putative protease